ncbi:MAG TPA: carboxypeptidase regulatory-like domain-containing protein [Pyrinomonadaceae bacterium]|nr:carboxypeptidase regulatory-like domain-containing protein [Pyrinomonadaceae bacterium]
MKKTLGSFVALNRRMFLLLGVVLCLAGFGIAAWQINAAENDGAKKNAEQTANSGQPTATPASTKPATRVEGIFRGVITPTKSDTSIPLRDMKPIVGVKTPKRPNEERDIIPRVPEIPKEQWKNDPVVQSFLGDREIPNPIVSFDGSPTSTAGFAPPDPNGDVGPNHVVTMWNSQFQIFTKTGTSVFGPANINTLFSGFGGACQTENAGDPVVLYDQLADRWFLMQFTAAAAPYFVCVAISTTSDPTGTYTRYAIQTGTSNFPDYPKAGVWSDAYYISTREFPDAGGFAGVGAYAINRTQALAGNPAAQVLSFLAPPTPDESVGDGLLPADLDGTTPPPPGSPNYFVGTQDTNGPYTSPSDAINIWKFTANFAVPASSSFVLTNTVPVGAFNSILARCGGTRACIPQLGTTHQIDHLGYRQRPLFRLAYRNFGTHESLVTNQSVSGGTGPGGEVSGIRWWEIRSPNSSPVIFQEGTFSPGVTDGIHRWMGAIAMDGSGNMGMGYSASSPTMNPSIFYTGRLVNDPLGTMPQGEASIMNGTGSATSLNRWGDYTSMSIDPTDDCTFWHVNEYYPVTSGTGWRLRVGSFKFPTCGVPTGTLSGNVTNCATSAPISGATVTLAPGGYVGGSIGSGAYTVTAPGGSYTATATKAGWTSGAGATGPVTITNGANTVANYCLIPAAVLDPTTTPALPTGNGVVEPNECNSINLPVTNSGTGNATAVSAVLSTTTPNVTITQPNSAYPDIAAGGTQTNTTPFQISTNGSVACFTSINLTLTVTYTGGTSPQVINFAVPVGQAANPNYTFTSTTGNTIPGVPANGVLVASSQADDAAVPLVVPAGFNFSLYGTPVNGGSTITVSTNGNIQIAATGANAWTNAALPVSAPGTGTGTFPAAAASLFPYWDDHDLRTTAFASGGIYTQVVGVAPSRQWVIEWRGQHFDDTGTAQTLNHATVFEENSDSFSYYYNLTGVASANGASATIGVQSASTGTQFTQFSFNTASITPGLRLRAARTAGACAPGTGGCATAAGVEVSGRVLTSAGGRGLRGAVVTLRDENGNEINTTTGAMGNFRFAEVEPGHTYVVTIRNRRFQYAPQVLTINDSVMDLVFTPE